MQSHEQEQKLTQTPQQPARRRFQIERLEERIAPAKGGVPGAPPYQGNKPICWGDNCCRPKHGCSL